MMVDWTRIGNWTGVYKNEWRRHDLYDLLKCSLWSGFYSSVRKRTFITENIQTKLTFPCCWFLQVTSNEKLKLSNSHVKSNCTYVCVVVCAHRLICACATSARPAQGSVPLEKWVTFPNDVKSPSAFSICGALPKPPHAIPCPYNGNRFFRTLTNHLPNFTLRLNVNTEVALITMAPDWERRVNYPQRGNGENVSTGFDSSSNRRLHDKEVDEESRPWW